MIHAGMMSSNTDLWETPQVFFDELNMEFGFDLDVCALPENAKCERYYTPKDDGLSMRWEGGLLHESAVWTTDRAMGGESLSCGAYRKGDGCMPPAGTNGHTMVSGLLSEIK